MTYPILFILLTYSLHGLSSPNIHELAWSKRWLRLLHYRSSLWSWGTASQVDGQAFFMHPNGRTDPEAELRAALKYMSHDSSKRFGQHKVHAQCAFPARFKFLNEKLPNRFTPVDCPRLSEILTKFNGQSLTYVFSTAFPNNPGSMFGHTFLRINAKSKPHQKRMELFDHGLSYAALTPPGFNTISFIFKGVFGGYPGFFSSPLYYEKIAEYTHFESRDIWEYDLNLTADETDTVIRAVWEIANNGYFDYYFLDENCAYHLLGLLEIGRPDWNLTSPSLFVSPVDSILALTNTPGAVTAIRFRPSVKSRFLTRHQKLTDEEQSIFLNYLKGNEAVPKSSKTLDALDAYFTYMKQRHSGELPKEMLERQYQVQIQRSESEPPPKVKETADTRPDIGHRVSRWNISHVQADSETSWDVGLKFAYHDLLSADRGFIPFSQIDFLEINVSKLRSESYYLQRVKFIELQSLYPMTFYEKRKSWRFLFDVERSKHRLCDKCTHWNLDGALGATFPTWGKDLFYGFLGADLDHTQGLDTHLGLKAEAGFIGYFLNYGKYWFGSTHLNYFGSKPSIDTYYFRSSWSTSQNSQIRASAEKWVSQALIIDRTPLLKLDLILHF